MTDKTKILKKHFESNGVSSYFLDKSRMLKAIYDAMEEYKKGKVKNCTTCHFYDKGKPICDDCVNYEFHMLNGLGV